MPWSMALRRSLVRYSALALALGLFALALVSFERPWYRPEPPVLQETPTTNAALAEAESRFPLRPGQAKEITWSLGEGRPTLWAIAYLHGFSASRREISPTLERLSEILRANVFWTRFTGHGMSGREIGDLTADDFFRDGEEALRVLEAIGEKRLIVGTSTGAAVATALALWHPERVNGIVLISPNFAPARRSAWLLGGPLGPFLGRFAVGVERTWTPRSEEQRLYWNTTYRTRGLTAMMDMINAVARMPLERMRVPCLVLQTPRDQVVSNEKAREVLARIPKGVCEFKMIEAEDHVLAGAITSPSTTETVMAEILAFLRRVPDAPAE